MFLVSKCRRDWHLDLCTFGYLHKENPRAMPNSDFPVDKTLSLGLTRFITKVTTRRIAYLSISRYPKLKSQQSNHSWVVMRSHMRFSVVFRRHSDSFSPGVISRVAHQWLIMLRPWRSFFQHISWPWKEGGLSLQQGVQGVSFFQLSYDSQKWKEGGQKEGLRIHIQKLNFEFHKSSWWCCFAPVKVPKLNFLQLSCMSQTKLRNRKVHPSDKEQNKKKKSGACGVWTHGLPHAKRTRYHCAKAPYSLVP